MLPLFTSVSSESVQGGQAVFYICISIGLTLLAGLMSGLTLGLMSMDHVDLEVLMRSGTEKEKKHAERIAPVLAKPHLLLVTLLLANSAAMEALPIFLDRLVSPIAAVALSVTVVLIFGEIVPQALCSRYGLQIGSYSAWFVRILIWASWIIAYPISKILDAALGTEHGALFRRGQLKALVDLHSSTEGLGGYLNTEEISVIRGALDLSGKQAAVSMTPLDKVFMLPSNTKLDRNTMKHVLRMGHSRVPVHEPGDRKQIKGLVLVKELALVDPDDCEEVKEMRLRGLPALRADIPMYDLLKVFQTGRSHMVVLTRPAPNAPLPQLGSSMNSPRENGADMAETVSHQNGHAEGLPGTVTVQVEEAPNQQATEGPFPEEPPADGPEGEPIGIITIEDVIEELLGQEIVDETDQYLDNLRTQKVSAAGLVKSLPPNLRFLVSGTTGRSSETPTGSKSFRRAETSRELPPQDSGDDNTTPLLRQNSAR